MPPERTAALRAAFMATMTDPEFLADMERLSMSVGPLSGEDMQKIVADAYAMPATLVDKIRALLEN